MRTDKLIALTALAALGLAGCNNANRANAAAGANSLCKPFTTAAANTATPGATALPGAAPAADPSAGLDDCLHRWGYSLAASTDPANIVADATLAACSQTLSNWNQSSLTTGGTAAPVEAPSLLTGQPTNPIAEHRSFAEGRALFYVVQARAGHCAPPPPANGAPAGRTG